jgi:hypothetical protein
MSVVCRELTTADFLLSEQGDAAMRVPARHLVAMIDCAARRGGGGGGGAAAALDVFTRSSKARLGALLAHHHRPVVIVENIEYGATPSLPSCASRADVAEAAALSRRAVAKLFAPVTAEQLAHAVGVVASSLGGEHVRVVTSSSLDDTASLLAGLYALSEGICMPVTAMHRGQDVASGVAFVSGLGVDLGNALSLRRQFDSLGGLLMCTDSPETLHGAVPQSMSVTRVERVCAFVQREWGGGG